MIISLLDRCMLCIIRVVWCILCNILICVMIKSFNHKGLERFFKKGETKGIQHKHIKKIRNQLFLINAAVDIKDIDRPEWQLHRLKPHHKNLWSIWVNGNWRITFEFKDGDAYILNYEDYH